jgi:glyoxylase-like metal-dependent hydrolase (beta-lactamase superfamily II)
VRILPLKKSDRVYSCHSYLILGDWNRVEDLNTLIDPGIDGFVLQEIETLSTGFGKVAVEQIILTHNHFDHAAGVASVKARYGARVLAFAEGPGVDELLPDGRFVKAGDDFLEVVHTPGHSSDSICLYASNAKALFSGDTQLHAHQTGEEFSPGYLAGIAKLAGRDIESIYSGHDAPLTRDCNTLIRQILAALRHSTDGSISEKCPAPRQEET